MPAVTSSVRWIALVTTSLSCATSSTVTPSPARNLSEILEFVTSGVYDCEDLPHVLIGRSRCKPVFTLPPPENLG
jgi:hypothetical protein